MCVEHYLVCQGRTLLPGHPRQTNIKKKTLQWRCRLYWATSNTKLSLEIKAEGLTVTAQAPSAQSMQAGQSSLTHLLCGSLIPVQALQPGLESLGVMRAVDIPLVDNLHVVLNRPIESRLRTKDQAKPSKGKHTKTHRACPICWRASVHT
jgi:hypothetical protein